MNTSNMISVTIAGIPALVSVTTAKVVKGSFSFNADSDMDYYGYSELEYDVYDRKGYKAAWLERKITDNDRQLIEETIWNALAESNEP